MNDIEKTFCPVVWLHQAVRTNGDFRVCCNSNVTENQGIARKDDGTTFNAGVDTIEDAYNSEILKRMRLTMLKGEWNPECGRCKVEEEMGLCSRRPNEIDWWKDEFTFEDAVKATAPDGSVALKPIHYDLRFGNFCNLKCRMCGPTESHSWYEEHVDYHNEKGFWDSHGFIKLVQNNNGRWTTNDYAWHESVSFWKNLEDNLPGIKQVYMAGGEPLLIDKHYEFLQKCIDGGYAKNIMLEYNTNLSVLPKRVLEMWTHFRRIRVGASIDGMDEMLEYQRYPLKWSVALKNLQILDQAAIEHDHIVPALSFTVTAYNAFHLPKFMWWKLFESGFKTINGVERRPVIGYHMCHQPERMCTQMYPLEIKNKLTEHYKEWIEKFEQSDLESNSKETAIGILEAVLNFTLLEDKSCEVDEFIRFTKYLDKSRGQNILDVAPELRSLFE